MGGKRERNKLSATEQMMNKRLKDILQEMIDKASPMTHIAFAGQDGELSACLMMVIGKSTQDALNSVLTIVRDQEGTIGMEVGEPH